MTCHVIRRLTKDYREIRLNPLPHVSAAPLPDNMLKWHVNLRGSEDSPYEGSIFHLELTFPINYPAAPPSVSLCTPFPHPHVHHERICLDLLSDYQDYFASVDEMTHDATTFSGWSPAYSVFSLLLQLQTFLLELEDEEGHPVDDRVLHDIPAAVIASLQYSCPQCPHEPGTPWPPFPPVHQAPTRSASHVSNGMAEDSSAVDDDAEDWVGDSAVSCDWDAAEDRVSAASSSVLAVSQDGSEQSRLQRTRDHLVCFHSRRTIDEDVIGVGLQAMYGRGVLRDCTCGLDFISFQAFTYEGARRAAVVQAQEFTHWMPLFVGGDHAVRALPLCKQAISYIHSCNVTSFTPDLVFDVLPKLMRSMVVQVMNGSLYASIRALEGFCVFHRWLLHFVQEYPTLLKRANTIVGRFIREPSQRVKSCVPNLGDLLMLLCIADLDYTWSDVAQSWLSECFDRNVMWMLRKYPHLARTTPHEATDALRPEQTLKAVEVSVRFSMFQVYFLKHIARPDGATTESIMRDYDSRYGQPSSHMKSEWQLACKAIQRVQTWEEVFQRLEYPAPSRQELTEWLLRAVRNSAQKGYHRSQGRSQRSPSKGPRRNWNASRGAGRGSSGQGKGTGRGRERREGRDAGSSPGRRGRPTRRGTRGGARRRKSSGKYGGGGGGGGEGGGRTA